LIIAIPPHYFTLALAAVPADDEWVLGAYFIVPHSAELLPARLAELPSE